MADFKDFLSTDGYLARLTRLNEIKTALAQWLSVGTHSNVPEGAIRWSQSQKRWEVYSGGTWGALETEYNVNVKQLQGAEPNTAASNSTLVKRTATGQVKAAAPSTNDEVTTRAFSDARYVRQENLGDSGGVSVENAAKLGGQLPAYYRNASNINAGTLPLARGGTGATSAGAARTSLGFTLSAPMLARLNAGKDHSLQVWQDGTATEGGLISPAQLAEAAGDKTAIGTVNWFALSTPPDGWLVCDGRAITSLYPDLRQALIDDGYPWEQDGSGNPLIPDLVSENRFIRAAGGDLSVGDVQGDAIRNITGEFSRTSDSGATSATIGLLEGAFKLGKSTFSSMSDRASHGSASIEFDASLVVPTADENRPKNLAMLPCIKAFGSAINIPGQAEIDNILQQTQVQVDLAAPAAVRDGLAWEQIAEIEVGTSSAVVITELDFSRETVFFLAYLQCDNSSSANYLRINSSEDGGSTWLFGTGFPLSAHRRWDNTILRGSLKTTPADGNFVMKEYSIAESGGVNANFEAQSPFISGEGHVVVSSQTNAVRFDWFAGSFRSTSLPSDFADRIYVYQRG